MLTTSQESYCKKEAGYLVVYTQFLKKILTTYNAGKLKCGAGQPRLGSQPYSVSQWWQAQWNINCPTQTVVLQATVHPYKVMNKINIHGQESKTLPDNTHAIPSSRHSACVHSSNYCVSMLWACAGDDTHSMLRAHVDTCCEHGRILCMKEWSVL